MQLKLLTGCDDALALQSNTKPGSIPSNTFQSSITGQCEGKNISSTNYIL
jgi:hypothetical protein